MGPHGKLRQANPTQLKGRERAMKINEGEWTGKAEMGTREKFMALNGKHYFVSSGFEHKGP